MHREGRMKKGNRKVRGMALGLCLTMLLGSVPMPPGSAGEVIVESLGMETIQAQAADPADTTATAASSSYDSEATYYFTESFDPDKEVEIKPGSKSEFFFAEKDDNMAVNEKLAKRTLTLAAKKNGNMVPLGPDIKVRLYEDSMKSTDPVAYAGYVLDGSGAAMPTSFNIIPNGPGTTQIMLDVVFGDGYYFNVPIVVNVDLEVVRSSTTEPNAMETGSDHGYFQLNSGDLEPAYSFKFQYPGMQYQTHIKYYDAASGSAVGVKKYDYAAASLSWDVEVNKDTSNRRIITIDHDGIMTSVGAGMADMIVRTTENGGGKEDMDTVTVVVPLLFSASAPTGSTVAKEKYSTFKDSIEITTGPNGQTYIYTTANDPLKDMEWYDFLDEKGNKVDKEWFEISYESMEATGQGASKISIKALKAGTYTLQGYMTSVGKSKHGERFDAKLTMHVPIDYAGANPIYMNVGDKYNLFKNTNIAVATDFAYESEDSKIVKVSDQKKGIFKAVKLGTTKIYAYDKVYGSVQAARDAGKLIEREIRVIDTLSLNLGEAAIAIGGTLNLIASTTDPTKEIFWEVEDDSILSIETNGGTEAVVKGLKAGTTIVTAYQTINGVEKSVSCEITVEDTITKIEMDPPEMELEVGEYGVIKASISKSNPSSANILYWVSSDPTIVALENPNNHTTTCSVQGLKPGTAIIMAVNKDNMIVGSCKVTVLQAPSGIKLSETSVTVPQSVGKYQLYASVQPTNATNQNIKWTSSNTKIADVDQNGLVTFKGYGTVTIIASCEGKPELTAMCELIITQGVTSIVVDQSEVIIEVGENFRLSYEVFPTTAYDRGVTFTSLDTKVATVDATGLITGKKAGTTYITVATVDGGYSKTITVKVKQAATTIKLDATGLVLDVGETYTLEVSFNPKTTTETKLTFSSNDKSVAKVDAKGVVTAVGPGDCIIAVTTSNNLTAFCYVTVNQQVEGVELDYDSIEVEVGMFVELEATVIPDDATDQEVKWKSSDTSVAKVSDNGTVKGIKGGSAIITVTTEEGGYSAVCLVTVIEPVRSIKLNKENYKLGLGKKFTLVATVGSETATDKSLTWVSSDPDICTVNQKGVITGVSLGRATITAYANDDSGEEAICEVRVVRQATSINVNHGILNMVVGDRETLKATIKPNNATFKTAKFKSSDQDVAIVDNKGVITAVGAGKCTVTARPKDNSGLKAVCTVIVIDPIPATGITVSPSEVTLPIGGSESVIFSLRPTNSTDSVTWTSNNRAIATVGAGSGIIKGMAAGSTTITATTSSGRTANVKVTVVGLNYESLTLEQYDTYRLQVIGTTSGIIWDVDNPNICTVRNGVVEGKRAGTTTVIARVNGAELRCRVTIVDMP